jgi:adenylosuccinate synthase
VGAQWGDEGKAKVIDLLAQQADVVVRCQGGCNAGHTVQHQQQTYKFHLIPSGILYPGKLCVVGSGTVIDPITLMTEIRALEARGIDLSGLRLSNRAHVTLPHHIAQDKASEAQAQAGQKIGTTGRGIGPTYRDKVSRAGFRLADIMAPEPILKDCIARRLDAQQATATVTDSQANEATTADEILAFFLEVRDILAPYVVDTVPLLAEAVKQGKALLFEGAQGTMLDVDFGTYPFVTSSNAVAGGACTGSGVGPTRIDMTIGVMKAYTTRVGSGPFPTELFGDEGRYLVETGQEYGTTTGRTRRCGWFDAVAGRFSVQVNGLDQLAITKLDVLDALPEVKICVAYQHQTSGDMVTQFPADTMALETLKPVYETWPGWQTPTSACRTMTALPTAARAFLARIETLLETPIGLVSVGPQRDATIGPSWAPCSLATA